MKSIGTFRYVALGFAFAFAAAAAIAGCAGGSAYAPTASLPGPSPSPSPTGGGSNCITAIAPAGTEVIGVNLTSQAACNDMTYQAVKGYFGGSTVTTSQVVSVTHSATNNIQFMNLDNQPHTATSLGPWSGSYPSAGPAFGTPSPRGTDVSAAGWSTGNLDPGLSSKTYVANVPGFYIIGCAYHYNSDNMRTVIIVQ